MTENQKKIVIVSHRLKGFDNHDASCKSLQNALAKKVTNFEVDCRTTKDSEIVIHHDARLGNEFTVQNLIADSTLKELKQIHYKNSSETILTIDELFQLIEPHRGVQLYLDIKESGKEEKIIAKAANLNLLDNITIVSWLPEVLFKINALLPTMHLCFSFYPVCSSALARLNYFNPKVKSLFQLDKKARNSLLYDSYNNENGAIGKYGFDFEHFVSLPFKGRLLEVLQSVLGIVCVNYKLSTVDFIQQLKKQNLQVCMYSINNEKDLRKYKAKFLPDIVLTDNPSLVINE